MRMSCNGCRVLRKGCTPDCPIRPCLHWIKSPLSQSNATLFLAKFYGRAGLLNLLTTGSPTSNQSLLYEACGRIVNPVSGSTGLLSTGSWHLCEAAVEAVLSGAPIQQLPSESALDGASPQLKACDIRHVAKSGKSCGSERLYMVKSRKRQFKRRAGKPKVDSAVGELVVTLSGSELDGSMSHDSGSGVSEHRSVSGEGDSGSEESGEPAEADDGELELELTLGWGPVKIPVNG